MSAGPSISADKEKLLADLSRYAEKYPGESETVNDFRSLLLHPGAFQRTHLPGHITGSAWIVNAARTKTLLVLHAKLGRWLQPGGHADGEEAVLNVALREAEEETGVKNPFVPEIAIFDLDIHPIPARTDFPAHLHYDIRYLVVADENAPLVISDESTDLRWFELEDLNKLTGGNRSVLRLAEKTKR